MLGDNWYNDISYLSDNCSQETIVWTNCIWCLEWMRQKFSAEWSKKARMALHSFLIHIVKNEQQNYFSFFGNFSFLSSLFGNLFMFSLFFENFLLPFLHSENLSVVYFVGKLVKRTLITLCFSYTEALQRLNCVYAYVYICMYIYIYIYVCACVCVIRKWVFLCVCVCVCVNVYAY